MRTIQIEVTEDEYVKLLKAKHDCGGCSWRDLIFDAVNGASAEPRKIGRPPQDAMDNLFAPWRKNK
jgi:hypothetical protein